MKSTDPRRVLANRFHISLQNWHIQEGSRILVACSGGPDSMALLDILWSIQEEYPLVLSCAYLDHGLRNPDESALDGGHVKKAANQRQIPYYTKRITSGVIVQVARDKNRSIEEEARNQRYAFLFELQRSIGSDYIALGHNADDQAETLLLRFLQGSTWRGLTGIPGRRENLLRPLLDTSRNEILNYLSIRNIAFRTDITNQNNVYLRNRIRNQLVPSLKKVFPGYRKNLCDLARKMTPIRAHIQKETTQRARWQKLDSDMNSYRINCSVFLRLPPVLRQESLYTLYDQMGKELDFPSRLPD